MTRYYRKCIRITAEDSPNVKLGLLQKRLGLMPDGTVVVPNVLTYDEYLERRATWSEPRQCVGLDAKFWAGKEQMWFPPSWLDLAARRDRVERCMAFKAEALGVDPAEGGDRTSMAAINRYGLKELVSVRTPDTNVVWQQVVAFGARHAVPPSRWAIDLGGGGKEHADRLRANGYPVQVVPFGGAPSLEIRRGTHQVAARKEIVEERAAYVNKRAEMYGVLRLFLDPGSDGVVVGSVEIAGFAIPEGVSGAKGEPRAELRHQMEPIPLKWDKDGRMLLLPKHNPTDPADPRTLVGVIGHSPDELDSVVLALHALTHKATRPVAGVPR